MHLSEDETRLVNDEELNALLATPATFDSTVKSFEVQARDIKRGFQVNQAINSLRVPGSSDHSASPDSKRKYASVTYTSGKSKQP
ncbi:hypothetical protein AFK24_22425 [Pseudomonas syringae]|jgi:hypothetical protein|uniref:Uncharacterized protein n=1 Tax=Pseudomonas syringae TaxID=317 RepID=A0A1C7Z3P1_PSESX|nr:hypothetical protein [Pseudomonas syringae]OCR22795.1 hypothetical protein AFK24_22425 [Pseudomonas syringae]